MRRLLSAAAPRWLLGLLLAATALPARPAAQAPQAGDDLAAQERVDADRLRRRGKARAARNVLSELLEDAADDAHARTLRALCWLEESNYERALADAERAALDLRDAPGAAPLFALAARNLALVLGELGRTSEALAALRSAGAALQPQFDARDAWALGHALLDAGERKAALEAFRLGGRTSGEQGFEALVAKARCQRALGLIERASQTLQQADLKAVAADGAEPDVLVALGELYFEAYREIDAPGTPAPGPEFKEALGIHPTHEGALLGLYELARFNPLRQNRPASAYLDDLFAAHPSSIAGLVASLRANLEDGKLVSARETLTRLEALAPARRDVRVERAVLHWIEHEREACEAILAELLAADPADGAPEREVGRHLLALYRFGEGLPFLERAVERDPSDYRAWTELGRALANTGNEERALEVFERAAREAQLRRDAWRENVALVLKKLSTRHTVLVRGDLSFSWQPDAAAVFETYLVPFYEGAREELARRYGFTPGPTRIEVFRDYNDFSVRSTGFEGFPALGVCFGPVVTAVSPLSQVRGKFNWAETAFHEFSHVIHLGLSHNRCPRWITEGLATWEETNKNPTWTRNMRRDLLDARANQAIIPVRDLNRAFRTSRILFAYYQGGLLCEMLIERHGFAPMVRLLEAFDRGLDLDQALGLVFGVTPEELDRDFDVFVARLLAGLFEEPRWDPARVARLRFGLTRTAPAGADERATWCADWSTVAWSALQAGGRVDAEEALRLLDGAGCEEPRVDFLRGQLELQRGADERARELLERGLARGGDSFRVRRTLAALAQRREDWDEAERHLLAAERAFPGHPDDPAELALLGLYELLGRKDDAMGALERYLAWKSGDYPQRLRLALWHVEGGRHAQAERLFDEANQVDPFRRALHRHWGLALMELGRSEAALREFRVALLVPHELDLDEPGPLGGREHGELLARQALALVALGRAEEAGERAREALALDEDCELAKRALEQLGATGG